MKSEARGEETVAPDADDGPIHAAREPGDDISGVESAKFHGEAEPEATTPEFMTNAGESPDVPIPEQW